MGENRKVVIWNLFDSGTGSYNQVLRDDERFDTYSIGLDIENKNDHFISVDLSDYSHIFGGSNKIFDELDRLPRPDIITASPPCESWSVASAMAGGNACWRHMKKEEDKFIIRKKSEYGRYRYCNEKAILTRINGELCTFNTISIIRRYNPKIYIIENPNSSRMWKYIEHILGFDIEFDNKVFYNNYGFEILKPTKFKSNIDLGLDKTRKVATKSFEEVNGYNLRSSIPEKLIKEIIEKCLKELT